MAKIHFDITGDNSNLVSTLNDTTQRMEKFSGLMKNLGSAGFDMSNPKAQLRALETAIKDNESVIGNYIVKIKALEQAQKEAALAGDEAKVRDIGQQLTELGGRMQETVNETNELKQAYGELNGKMKENDGIMVKLLGGQQNYNAILSQLPGPLRSAVTGLNGMVGAAKAFIATPLGAVLAALILAFKALQTWLTKTAEGQQALAKITGYFTGVMSALENIVKQVGKAFYDAFTNPKQAAQDFVNFLKNQVVNRVEALGGIFVNLGKIIKNVFSGDFDAVKEAASNLGDMAIQFGTGFKAEDVKKAVTGTIEEINRIGEAESALNARRFKLQKERAEWAAKEAALDEKIAQARIKMYSGSTEERQKAAAEAEALINQKYAQRIKFAQEEYKIKKESNALTDSSQDDLNEENRLLASVAQERAARTNALAMFTRRGHSADEAGIKAEQKAQNELTELMLQNEEKRVAMIADEGEREAAAINLKYKKSMHAIQKQREAWMEQNRQNTGNPALSKEQESALKDAENIAGEELIKDNGARLEKLAKQYQTYTQQRQEIIEKGISEALELEAAGYEEEAEERRKAMEQELTALDSQNNEIYKRLAQDTTKWGVVAIQKAITDAQAEVNRLSATPEMATANAQAIDNLLRKIEQLKQSTKDFSARGLLGMLFKPDESGGKSGAGTGSIVERMKAIRKQWDALSKEDKWKNIGGYAATFGDMLTKAAGAMKEIAEATGDDGLANAAETMEGIGGMVSNIGQSFAQGGPIGGAIAAVQSIFDATLDAITNIAKQEAIAKKYADDWAAAVERLSISVDDSAFQTIFGQKDIDYGRAKLKEATSALALYRREVGNLSKMNVKTYDSTWWERLWGGSDKYTNLKALAPEMFNQDGGINVEYAKKFLEVNEQLTDEQRKQIENAISLKEQYDEAMATVDGLISDTFGNLASDITDLIWDSVMSGSDAWEQFEEVGSEAIANLGKQLIQEMLISEYLEQFRERMRKAYDANNSSEETQKQLRNIVGDIFGGMQNMLAAGSLVAEEYKSWADEHGFDLTKLNAETQTATAGGFETMSQDTASELNGRFTALQLSNELISQSAQAGIEFLSTISAMVTSGSSTLSEIRNLHMLEVGYLEDISKYTKTMAGFEETLNKIEQNTSKL